MKSLAYLMLAGVLALGSLNAEAAKRLGGGKSMGQQSGNVAQRNTAPAAPANQAAPAAAPKQAAPAAPAATPAAAPKKPWGAMLGGLAAGLGLAWLASSLGLGEAFGQILLFGLLALAVMAVVGMILRKRAASASNAVASPLAFEGAGAGVPRGMPRQYSPDHVVWVAGVGCACRFRHRRLPDRGQAQFRHPAGRLGPLRHPAPARHDDR